MSYAPARLAASFARHRSVLVIAVVSVVASSGTAAAVSYLVLGATNTSAATTTLKSGTNGAVLQLTNTNATGGTSARGLSISVPAGRAPISVNATAGKATNLNADKLDGLDSTRFARGSHTTVVANRIVVPAVANAQPVILDLPGLGEVVGECSPSYPDYAYVVFINNTSQAVRAFLDGDTSRFQVRTLESGQIWTTTAWNTGDAGLGSTSLEVGAGTGSANRSASVRVIAYRPALGSGCEFQASAILWSST